MLSPSSGYESEIHMYATMVILPIKLDMTASYKERETTSQSIEIPLYPLQL